MGAKSQDLFMQWYPVSVGLDASDSSTLVEEEFTTGLSIRGEYAWLIHTVEMWCGDLQDIGADNVIKLGLSTTQGETAFPSPHRKGSICTLGFMYSLTTSGAGFLKLPLVWNSLPPTIIAAPKLSFYACSEADEAALRDEPMWGRIGYTTVPIDQKTYLEIAETFEVI